MSKKTAVEWFESRIKVLIPDDIGSQLMFKSNLEKAKAKEAEQQNQHAIDFAKWLAENDWMSTWVVDKWMWENVNDLYPPNHKHHGMYYTEEELYELFKKKSKGEER